MLTTPRKIPHRLDQAGKSAASLCLDFANALRRRLAAHPLELLGGYRDIVAWSRRHGVLTEREARALVRAAKGRPEEAAAVHRRAIRLREAIYRIFSAVARAGPPGAEDLTVLNATLGWGLARLRIVRKGEGFTWEVSTERESLERPIWPVARSAADLLATGDLPAVRSCAGHKCAWLFLDESRNKSRRWCDMRVCGNRAKARRHYERQRSTSRPRPGALRS